MGGVAVNDDTHHSDTVYFVCVCTFENVSECAYVYVSVHVSVGIEWNG